MSAAPRGAPGENWVSRDQDGCRRQALRRPRPRATRPRSGGGGRPRPGRTTPPRIPGPSNPAWRGGGSGPRGARRNVQDVPRGAEKSQRVPLASPRLASFLSGVLSCQTLLLRPRATRPRSGGGGRPRPGRTTPPRIPGPSNPAWRGGGSGPRGARRNVQDVPRGAEKSQRVPLASPRLASFLSGVLSQTLLLRLPCGDLTTKIQLSTVDHSVRGSMKTAANCES